MISRLNIILLFIVVVACDAPSTMKDPNDSYFIKFYGGDGEQTGDDFVELPDGSMILFGTSRPSAAGSKSQWYLVKVDGKGNVIHSWGKNGELIFGGPNDEEARDIELTNDNRIVLVGNTYKSATDRDVKVMTLTLDGVKIDSAQVPIFTSAGVDPFGDEDAASITQTTDGFIIAGSTTYVTLAGKTANPGYADTRDGINIRLNNNLTAYTLNGWPLQQSYGYFSDDVS
ncbi:MAG TPA: hypothetical protein PLR06_13550, partial [Cyclobacteriaceae bacterium]|nr:hypothetical protein [Cyclobacteriaceae bacterium]